MLTFFSVKVNRVGIDEMTFSMIGKKYNPITEGKRTEKDFFVEFYYPDKADKRKEEAHQIDCMNWLRANHAEWMAYHVENEIRLSHGANRKIAAKGRLSGVVDIIIPTKFGCYYTAAIELKRATKSLSSPVSDEELLFMKHCSDNGAYTAVCYGYSSFLICIKELESMIA